MKRLLSLALLVSLALHSAATPMFASAFGLCYDRNKCGQCCPAGNKAWNAFSDGCCGGGCGCGYGCCGYGCGLGGLDAFYKDCQKKPWWKCPPLIRWCDKQGCKGCQGGAGDVVWGDGAIEGGVVGGGVVGGGVVEGGVVGGVSDGKPCPCAPADAPKPGPIMSEPPQVSGHRGLIPYLFPGLGYVPYGAPAWGAAPQDMIPRPEMQPVSYQQAYQGYSAYPVGYTAPPAWNGYQAPAYYQQPAYYQAPMYYQQPACYQAPGYYQPSAAPDYWYPAGR